MEYDIVGDEGVLSAGEYPPEERDLWSVLDRGPDAAVGAESPTDGIGTISSIPPKNGVERGGVGLEGVT